MRDACLNSTFSGANTVAISIFIPNALPPVVKYTDRAQEATLDLECLWQPFSCPTLKSHLSWDALEGSPWAVWSSAWSHLSSKRPHPPQGPHCVSGNSNPTVLRWLPFFRGSERLWLPRPQPGSQARGGAATGGTGGSGAETRALGPRGRPGPRTPASRGRRRT